MSRINFSTSKGFTLVELLIVIVILAVLAGIVIPQFTDSTTDAKESALVSSLAGVRGAIAMYYQQHQHYPGAVASTGATCPNSGTAGLGVIDTEVAFLDHLTRYTNVQGQSCTTTNAEFKFGPYYAKDALPNDPIIGEVNAVVVLTAGDLAMVAPGTAGGWIYDNITGKFLMNHTSYDDR